MSNQSKESNGTSALDGLCVGLVALLLAQIVVGVILAMRYTPTLAGAHPSVEAIRSAGITKFLAGFHYWGSAFLIVCSFLNVAIRLWTGRYVGNQRSTWLLSIAIFLCAFAFQATGNLLPMDRHDVQTAVVEAGIAGGAPWVGGAMRQLTLGGSQFGQPTLSNWFMAHEILLTGLSIALAIWAFLSLRRTPRQQALIFAVNLPLLVMALALLGTPTGAGATQADFGQFDALPSWYTWSLHGSLRAFQTLSATLGWVGALAVPGLFVGFLASLPLISKRLSATGAKVVFAGFLVFFAGASIGYGGKIAPIAGNQGPFDSPIRPVKPSPTVDPQLIARGQKLFNTAGCADCHGTDGISGDVGPALKDQAAKGHDNDWLIRFITDPQKVKPGSTMPGFGGKAKPDEIQAIAAFVLQPKK